MADQKYLLEKTRCTVKDNLIHQIDEMGSLSRSLFESLTKEFSNKNADNSSNSSIDNIVDGLISKDASIKTLIDQAISQVDKEREVEEARSQLAQTEKTLLQLHNNLREAEIVLATALHQASKKLQCSDQAKKASMNCEDLIKFAFRISSGNSVEAPTNWVPGDPRRPYPQDIEMRCGMLGQLSQQKATEQHLKVVPSNEVDSNEFLGEIKDDTILIEPTISAISESTSVKDGSSNNGAGIWQVPVSEDMVHLMTMPVSAMTTNNVNSTVVQSELNGTSNQLNEVEYMSTSSDSSSSGDSL